MIENRQKENLFSYVRDVWRRGQTLYVTAGTLALSRWIIPLFLAVMAIDWLMDLPAALRVTCLAGLLFVSVFKAWRCGWLNVRAFNATHSALRIEEHIGGFESLLVSAVQLRASELPHGTSESLRDMACSRAEQAVGPLRPADAVDYRSLRRPMTIAIALVLFVGIFAIVDGPTLAAGAGRVFAPWLDIQYPTRTQLEVLDGDMIVKAGGRVKIGARVSGVIPERAKIALRTGTDKSQVRELDITDGECAYNIESVFRGFEYRILAGDAKSRWHRVQVIAPPRIKRAEVTLKFPPYTKRPDETVEALTLTVPDGTNILWQLTLDRAISEAYYNPVGSESIPLDVSADGRTVTMRRAATESRAYHFLWKERKHGFEFKSPRHALQVTPDQAPHVELTSPARNLYATLGRKLDIAFRGRDDHGVAESVICYRTDKRAENRLRFTPAKPIDGTEQVIDWDYRSVLPNLRIGQAVTFVVELADRYPGQKGPHRVRSEARRMQFLSVEDYLAQIEKRRQRLLSRLRVIYREERAVHDTVRRMNPRDDVFVQTCQLEAVRQDLIRERLSVLTRQLRGLIDDLATNNIPNEKYSVGLARLCKDIQAVADKHVGSAASAFRTLAAVSGNRGGDREVDREAAVHRVNTAARELGLLVLQLGFRDAAEVMARELHAATQTQASLRLRTIIAKGDTAQLAKTQTRLKIWLSRLLAASPKGKESTINDALIEFTLTRMVKQLINGGLDARLQKAATLIGDKKPIEAARLQSETIAALLKAEFRLRVGSEREALAKAMGLFRSQAEALKKLRLEMQTLDAETFRKRHASLATAQASLHGNLQMLLMPEIPARRARLFDDAVPTPPEVADLLAATDAAMTQAVAYVEKGDRVAAEKAQAKAESSFAELAETTKKRIVEMIQVVMMERLAYGAQEICGRLESFRERQLSLLEKTEDAAAKGKSEYLATLQEALVEVVDGLETDMVDQIRTSVIPSAFSLSLPARLGEALQAMRKASPLLKGNKPGQAVKHQKAAIAALAGAEELLAEHATNIGFYASMLSQAKAAIAPSSYLREIEEEQRDMLTLTRKTKPDDMPMLAIPQKNLIHAVNATLVALDPIAHMVESGTVMLFAKDDMDDAGTALAERDVDEALDAQEYIVETLGKLRTKIDATTPQYLYVLEVVEALHETSQEGVLIREAQRKLREKVSAKAADPAGLAKEQGALKARAEAYSKLIDEISGLGIIVSSVQHMADAEKLLKDGDTAAAVDRMSQAEQALQDDAVTVLKAMETVIQLLAPPIVDQDIPPGFVRLQKILVMAAQQKDMYRQSYTAKPQLLKGYEPKLRGFEKACGSFISRKKQSSSLHLKLVAAQSHLAKAAAGAKTSDRTKVVTEQKMAATSLRQFIVARALDFWMPPGGPAPPAPPAASDVYVENDFDDLIFAPGMVSGKRPPDGKVDWEVLGKRNRAALNENFARELPLEYRAILKDYYERLTR
ncbi:MAG: hypothetical protein HN350_16125 [Phycisphaerales bacterium]|nr:hypothetical protein [Phycisphaerales bacterium]